MSYQVFCLFFTVSVLNIPLFIIQGGSEGVKITSYLSRSHERNHWVDFELTMSLPMIPGTRFYCTFKHFGKCKKSPYCISYTTSSFCQLVSVCQLVLKICVVLIRNF